jgi:hypothetical protein
MKPEHYLYLSHALRQEYHLHPNSWPVMSFHEVSVGPRWECVTVLFADDDTVYIRTFEYNPCAVRPTFSAWELGSLDYAYADRPGLLPTHFGDGACVVTRRPYYDATVQFNKMHLEINADIDPAARPRRPRA